MGEVAEKAMGLLLNFVIFSFSQTPAQGLTAQAGSDSGEDGAGLWLALGICTHTCPHSCPHTCPSSSLYGLQAMTDCVWELETVTYSGP